MTIRKLPRCVRKINVGFQIVMILLGVANFGLSIWEREGGNIPKEYYQICAILEAMFPVAWSRILDSLKQYQNDLTPSDSPTTSPNNSKNNIV